MAEKKNEKKELNVNDVQNVSGGQNPTKVLDRFQDGIKKPEDTARRH